MKMMKLIRNIVLAGAVAMSAVSCSEKYFGIETTDYLTGEKAAEMVENDPEYLASYVSGLYSFMVQYNAGGTSGSEHDDFGMLSCLMIGDWMAGDIVLHGARGWGMYDYAFDYREYDYKRPTQLWSTFYTLINNSNTIIDFFQPGVDPSNPSSRANLGQAYMVRAISYLYLMMYFQDPTDASGAFNKEASGVPIVYATRDAKSSDIIASRQGRNTLGIVCEHIEENINAALPLLDGYVRPSKMFIDKQVAQGLAARYYLYTQQWEKAAAMASEARKGYVLMDADRLYSGFMDIEDAEVMWGFNHTAETQTTYASFFSQMSNDCPGYAGLDQLGKLIDRKLYDAIPNTDLRKGLFNGPNGGEAAADASAVASTLPYAARKFGYMDQWLQDYIYLRASEMYLIEAESLIHLGKQSEAQAVLAEFAVTRNPAWNQDATLEEVHLQRRIELWGEGLSYYDRRRNSEACIRSYEGTNHNMEFLNVIVDVPAHHKYWLFQIPQRELQENIYITEKDQNPL